MIDLVFYADWLIPKKQYKAWAHPFLFISEGRSFILPAVPMGIKRNAPTFMWIVYKQRSADVQVHPLAKNGKQKTHIETCGGRVAIMRYLAGIASISFAIFKLLVFNICAKDRVYPATKKSEHHHRRNK